MKILYHLTILPPRLPEAEALSQEIKALSENFGGELVYLNPNQHSPVYLPRFLFGFQKLRELRRRETSFNLHHLYNPDAFPFPVARFLRRPVVYTISSGVSGRRPNVNFFRSMSAVAVSDQRSLSRLQEWGIDNSVLVQPGIATGRFSYSPIPLGADIKLMVGSAPWTRGQFRTKGVDALLEAAQQNSHLKLVFLWRGVLAEEIERRVRRMNLDSQVTILDRLVDVNQILARVHASVVLAADPGIVKAYPHSLLESLAAGKPVLISRAIPMADYVEETGCGLVVDHITATAVLETIEMLINQYRILQESARLVGRRDFSQQAMIASYRRVYERFAK